MIPLPDTTCINGTGIPDLTSTCLKRFGNICLYQRSDDVFEVFKVQVSPQSDVFGVTYPEREVYPGNEDFGKTAWCYRNKEKAHQKYMNLTSRLNHV